MEKQLPLQVPREPAGVVPLPLPLAASLPACSTSIVFTQSAAPLSALPHPHASCHLPSCQSSLLAPHACYLPAVPHQASLPKLSSCRSVSLRTGCSQRIAQEAHVGRGIVGKHHLRVAVEEA